MNCVPNKFEFIFSKYSQPIALVSLVLTSITGLLLFNLRISEGGDDSAYIARAMDLLATGRYPGYQGPLYPFFLAIVLSVTGYHLGLLKITSLLLMLLSNWLLYRAFRNKIGHFLLGSVLLWIALNSWVLFFASQTYSEALFMVIQNIFLGLLIDQPTNHPSGKRQWAFALLLAGITLLAFLTRTIGIGMAVATVAVYAINRNYRPMARYVVLTAGLFLLWTGAKQLIWNPGSGNNKQLSELLQKHPYDKSEGSEDASGFAQRVVDNSNLYLSKHFIKMIGFKKADSKTVSGLITLLLYLLFLYGMYRAYFHQKALFATGIYVAIMLALTFVSLQKLWDQYRLIVPFFAPMLLILGYGLEQLSQKLLKSATPIALLLAIGMATTAAQTIPKIQSSTLVANLKGNRFEGYTPDWVHYLQMCSYAGEALPDSAYAGCRKPDMARLYANGKKFYGIFRFDSENPDTLLAALRERKVTHLILASLRKNPEIDNGEVINTLHRYMAFIGQKYPQVFQLEHQIGNTEPAYLFSIRYHLAATPPEQKP